MSTNTNSSLTSKDWLVWAQGKLEKAGIATARLDCLVLLEDATQKDRSYLLAESISLRDKTLNILSKQIDRRLNHEPLAYIRGRSEFYGREFVISSDTLQPRPETETMVELLKQVVSLYDLGNAGQLKIVDVGTGSGCLAITAKLEIPKSKVIATDISQACLKIARLNSKKHRADVEFVHGDLLQPLAAGFQSSSISIILANLPYVPDSHTINQAAMHEPLFAIFGGSDGLDLYRRMFKEIKLFRPSPAFIFTESLPFQHKELAYIASASEYKELRREDFVQVFSFVS